MESFPGYYLDSMNQSSLWASAFPLIWRDHHATISLSTIGREEEGEGGRKLERERKREERKKGEGGKQCKVKILLLK